MLLDRFNESTALDGTKDDSQEGNSLCAIDGAETPGVDERKMGAQNRLNGNIVRQTTTQLQRLVCKWTWNGQVV